MNCCVSFSILTSLKKKFNENFLNIDFRGMTWRGCLVVGLHWGIKNKPGYQPAAPCGDKLTWDGRCHIKKIQGNLVKRTWLRFFPQRIRTTLPQLKCLVFYWFLYNMFRIVCVIVQIYGNIVGTSIKWHIMIMWATKMKGQFLTT